MLPEGIMPPSGGDVIVDANYTFEQAIAGTQAPPEVVSQLTLLNVEYYGFDKKLHRGQLVINKKLANDARQVFDSIKAHRFPIERVIPIVKYHWDDESSMEDNNTSSFNFRYIAGSKKMSKHSTGEAIDFNTKINPYIKGDIVQPKNAHYDSTAVGAINHQTFLYQQFIGLGWAWGGDWVSLKDYQHFEK